MATKRDVASQIRCVEMAVRRDRFQTAIILGPVVALADLGR
jgi:hypothetical protein